MNEQRRGFSEAWSRENAIHLIKELADLLKAGILTEEEFNAKKQELLSRI
jgi:hypothetical protein